jgi:hypothetical protein
MLLALAVGDGERTPLKGALEKGSKHNMFQVLAIDFSSSHRCVTDPLVHHGRHFARTVHALCNIQALMINGMLHIGELADLPAESFTAE